MSSRRRQVAWQCRDHALSLGSRTLVMGILNVTPDSFSDGGRYLDPEAAVTHALEMARSGADIIDVGGESTRPGSERVARDEEIRRVVPVIKALRGACECLVSVDTMKADVAREAMEAGAHIINDVSAFSADPEMIKVAMSYGSGVVLMHMRGEPRTMQEDPQYDDVVADVCAYLRDRLDGVVADGLGREQVALDPGIGFGKTVQHNVDLVAGLDTLAALDRPILIGLSRKSFLGKITGREADERLPASLGATAFAIAQGAHIVRVHDVKETCDMVRVVDMLATSEGGPCPS